MGITVNHSNAGATLGLGLATGQNRYRESRRQENQQLQLRSAELARQDRDFMFRASQTEAARQYGIFRDQQQRQDEFAKLQWQEDNRSRAQAEAEASRREVMAQQQRQQLELQENQAGLLEQRYSSQQKQELARLAQLEQQVQQDPSWSPDQKQAALWQIQQRRAGLTPQALPKKQTNPWPEHQQPGMKWVEDGRRYTRDAAGNLDDLGPAIGSFAEGQGIGDVWETDSGMVFTRDHLGSPKLLHEPPEPMTLSPEKYATLWTSTYDNMVKQAIAADQPVPSAAAVTNNVYEILRGYQQVAGGSSGGSSQQNPEQQPQQFQQQLQQQQQQQEIDQLWTRSQELVRDAQYHTEMGNHPQAQAAAQQAQQLYAELEARGIQVMETGGEGDRTTHPGPLPPSSRPLPPDLQ